MSAAAISALLRSLRPSFSCPADRITFAAHAWMMSRGYKLVAVGDANYEGAASRPEIDLHLSGSDHTLLYADDESAGSKAPVTLRIVPLGSDKLLINLLSHDGTAASPQVLDVDVKAFTNAGQEAIMEGYKDLSMLLSAFDTKLAASSAAANISEQSKTSNPNAPQPGRQPSGSSLLEERQPRGAGGLRVPIPGGGDVGSSDLYPPGVGGGLIDPMRGPMVPGRGGMHVGPGDPMFAGGMRGPLGPQPGTFPAGGRWDPIAPPGMQGFNPDDFRRGGPRPPFHPDVQPPGPGRGTDWDNMFG